MDFSGPERADLADVQSLNHAFLECVRSEQSGRGLREQLTPSLRPVIVALSDLQIRRLAASPFLLLSLREGDDDYWDRLFAQGPNGDLFNSIRITSDASHRIVAAALGFLWQLARRDPHAARLVSGASVNWCEQLAARTLLGLLQHAADRSDLLGPRSAGSEQFWRRLLGAGISAEQNIRNAAHLAALQTVLIDNPAKQHNRFRAAACNTLVPTLSVAHRRIR
ncbi:MAG: hypothetical protein IIA07_02250 [Proteobacteria bacterium]|nr:hypothetical protein [Pseudomonadota bacterium]